MAVTELLRLVIQADTAGAVRGIDQVGKAADRALPRAEKNLDRLGAQFTKMGAAGLAFGAVAAAGLFQAARSAGELEQAVGGTEAVFKDASGTIDDYAANAADKVGLSEAAFRTATTSIGGQLKRMGLDVDDAAARSIELTETAADLAATYGGTTREAVEALGSAFRGEADPAERFNLDLKVSKVNAEAVALGLAESTAAVDDHARAQAILSLVTKQSTDAQGQFARESDTLAGRQQRLAATFENLKAEIGAGALPVLEDLFSVAKTGIGAFQGLNEATGGLAGKAATWATVGTLGLSALSLIAGQAIRARDTLKGFGTAVSNLPVGARRAALALGAVGAALTTIEILTSRNEANARGWVEDRIGEVDVAQLESVRDALREAREELDRLDDREGKGRLFSIGGANVFATEGDEERQNRIDALRGKIGELEVAEESLSAANRDAAGSFVGLDGAMDSATESTVDAVGAWESYADAMQAALDPLFGMADALNDNAAAQAEVAAAQTAVNEAMAAGDPDALAEANQRLAEAHRAAAGTALDVTGAVAALEAGVESGTVSVAAARRQLNQWVEQGLISKSTADVMAASFGAAARKADDLAGDYRVNVKATDNVSAVVDRINDKMAQLHDRTLTVRTHFVSTGQGGSGGIPLFHQGGIVPGPRGQEIAAILQAGERVISLAEMDAMRSPGAVGGGGGTVVNYNVHVDGGMASAAEIGTRVVEAIKGYERRNGNGWRR